MFTSTLGSYLSQLLIYMMMAVLHLWLALYAGTKRLALTWTWFCVGETAGRTNLVISLFFTQGIRVMQRRMHAFVGRVNEVKSEKYDLDGQDGKPVGYVSTEHQGEIRYT